MTNPQIIEACRKALTGFEKNDKTDLLNVLADDVAFEFSDSLPYGGTYNGKAVSSRHSGSTCTRSNSTSTTTHGPFSRPKTMSSFP